MTQDNAGIYFYGPPLSSAQVATLAEGAQFFTENNGNKTRISLKWPDVTLVMTIDPEWNRQVQLSGIRGWLSRFPEQEKQSPTVQRFLADLEKTTTCYGSVITPAFDRQGKVSKFLKSLLRKSGGFFFSHQSFYDSNGQQIVGLPGDPNMLGPK